jgi:hypothetical protein
MKTVGNPMKYLLIAFSMLVSPALAQTAEPSTRELLAIINERTARTDQRFSDNSKAIDAALSAAKDAVAAALIAAERATTKAEVTQNQRLDSQNEFRGQLKDQASTLMPRVEVIGLIKALDDRFEVRIRSVEDKFTALSQQVLQASARAEGAAQTWGYITVGMGLAFAGLTLFVTFRNRRPG